MIVRYTRQALADLGKARSHIVLDGPVDAAAIAVRIRSTIDGLRLLPERGRPGRVGRTRELVVPSTPFVVYRIAAGHTYVLAILHTARMWPSGFN